VAAPAIANRASTAAWWVGLAWAQITPVEDVPDELVVSETLVLLVLLIAEGPFEAEGQNLPVCCRQLNSCSTCGSTGVPSGLRTKSRKASLAMCQNLTETAPEQQGLSQRRGRGGREEGARRRPGSGQATWSPEDLG
jgi:hypothetical protein